MSTNLERITSHNDRLEAMKETVAGLPESGSGSETEVELVTLTFNSSLADNNGGMVFCYYDEENNHWDLAGGFSSVGIVNETKTTYKLRKNSYIIVSNELWKFSPSSVMQYNGGNKIYKIVADATATFD